MRIPFDREVYQTIEALRAYVDAHHFYLLFHRKDKAENFCADHIYASTTDLAEAMSWFDALVPAEGMEGDAFIATITGDCISARAMENWMRSADPLERLLFSGRAAGLYTSDMLLRDRIIAELGKKGFVKVKGRPAVAATLKKDDKRYEFRESKDLDEFLSIVNRAEALMEVGAVEEADIHALEEAMESYREVGARPL